MKLYGTPPTRAARVLWVLKHLEIDCEIVFISLRRGDHRQPSFLALNPAARIPVLVDEDLVLTESIAICLYLAEKYPEGRLLPNRLEERAQLYKSLFFLNSEIEAPLERMERHQALYAPEDRNQREVEIASGEAKRACEILETTMANREWMVGERLSMLDMVAAYTLAWAGENNLLEACPTLRRYVERMYALDSAPPTNEQAIAALREKPGEEIDWLGDFQKG